MSKWKISPIFCYTAIKACPLRCLKKNIYIMNFFLHLELTHWKNPHADKDWRQKEKRWQRMRWLASITKLNEHEFEQTVGDSGGHAVVHEITKSWTQFGGWTTTTTTTNLEYINLSRQNADCWLPVGRVGVRVIERNCLMGKRFYFGVMEVFWTL